MFDMFSQWGMSLSYTSADNSAGSASPVTLADTLVGDDSEFIIMTDDPCGQEDCGTVRPGTVAYRKFLPDAHCISSANSGKTVSMVHLSYSSLNSACHSLARRGSTGTCQQPGFLMHRSPELSSMVHAPAGNLDAVN